MRRRWQQPQLQTGDPGKGIEAGLASDADRLKRERVIQPADHGIGSKAETDCSASRYPDIAAGKCARTNHVRGRKYMPHQGGVTTPSKIHSEALNVRAVMLGGSVNGPEEAIEIADRPDHERGGGSGAAFEHADHRAGLGARYLR